MVAEREQQLAGICGLLGARSHQTEGNPARCWQGRSSRWGASSLGVLGNQSHSCQGSGSRVPPQLPEQGPPSPAVGPYGPSPSPGGVRSNDTIDRNSEEAWGLFCNDFKMLIHPPPPLAVPRWATLAHSTVWNPSPLPARQ